MATEWFYTTNKTEMGPVSWQELTELVQAGILKPHDLVWSEGMDDWIKAINQEGLFTDADTGEKVKVKKSAYTAPKPPPGRRTKRTDEDEDEDDEDETEARKKARKREEDRARTGVGIKVGLILAGVLVLLLLLVCGGGGILVISFWPAKDGGGGGGGPRRETYTVSNLNAGQVNDRTFTFKRGQHLTITSTNTTQFQNTDVDIFIFRGNEANPFQGDNRVPAQDRNCRFETDIQADGNYKIRVHNLGPGRANRCDVVIDVR